MRKLKRELRRELIERRKALDRTEKAVMDNDIFERIKPFLDKASAVFVYASTETEVDTRRIISYCLEHGITTALPVSGDTELTFYCIDSTDDLKTGRFGIDEPKREKAAVADERTLCVVPALCADGNGYRLGYGRGYYDRFLSGFCGVSVILCYRSFKREIPREAHDIKADFTIFNSSPN